jgi:hypothetical protein
VAFGESSLSKEHCTPNREKLIKITCHDSLCRAMEITLLFCCEMFLQIAEKDVSHLTDLKLGEKMHHQSNRQRLDLKELCIGTF